MPSRRTIITISDSDKAWLENYSKTYGISLAEAIRRGIAQLKEKEGEGAYEKTVRQTRGIWKKGDGLRYQRRSRSEWRSR